MERYGDRRPLPPLMDFDSAVYKEPVPSHRFWDPFRAHPVTFTYLRLNHHRNVPHPSHPSHLIFPTLQFSSVRRTSPRVFWIEFEYNPNTIQIHSFPFRSVFSSLFWITFLWTIKSSSSYKQEQSTTTQRTSSTACLNHTQDKRNIQGNNNSISSQLFLLISSSSSLSFVKRTKARTAKL